MARKDAPIVRSLDIQLTSPGIYTMKINMHNKDGQNHPQGGKKVAVVAARSNDTNICTIEEKQDLLQNILRICKLI